MDEIASLAQSRQLPPPPTRRALRIASGLTTQEVANALGVTRSAVHRWETGKRNPSGELRIRYADLLRDLAGVVAR